MKGISSIFIVLALLTGCAQGVKVKETPHVDSQNIHVSQKQKIENAIRDKQRIEQSLDDITNQAIEAGESAVSYLSSDLFLKANDAALKGDPVTAVLIYKYIVKMKPNDIYLRKKYAVELIKANRLREAQKQLVFLINSQDSELAVKAKLLLAGVYTALNQKEKAIENYREIVLKKGGDIPEACIFLSKSYVSVEKFKRAYSVLDFCSKKTKEIKNKSHFSYFKGKLEFDRERSKYAIRHLKKALKQDKENYQAVLLLGHIYEIKEMKSAAKKLYYNFLERSPSSYSVLSKYVNLLFAEGEYARVIPYLEKLLAIDEENLNLKVRLGVLYTEANRIEEAKGIFKEILEVIPDSDKVLYYLGSLYQQSSENEGAIEYFSKISEESALYHESNIQIAQILNTMAMNEKYRGLNKTEKEDRFLSFVDKKQKTSDVLNIELNVVLAGYFEANKNFDDAIKTMEKVRHIEGFSEGHDYYLAALYEKVKDYKSAEAIISSMLEKNPENPHALNFLGYSLLERGGDMKKAYEYINKAVSIRPDDGYIRDSLGWYYYKKGEFDKAFKETYKAWQLVKDDVVISKHLALIYKAMNNYDKAKEHYVEALRNCKAVAEREEVIKELESLESMRVPASR